MRNRIRAAMTLIQMRRTGGLVDITPQNRK